MAVEFVKAGSDEAKEINRILLKEVDKKRYTAKQICKMMQDEGFPKFDQEHHTRLWKELGAKDPTKGFGKVGDYKGCVYRKPIRVDDVVKSLKLAE